VKFFPNAKWRVLLNNQKLGKVDKFLGWYGREQPIRLTIRKLYPLHNSTQSGGQSGVSTVWLWTAITLVTDSQTEHLRIKGRMKIFMTENTFWRHVHSIRKNNENCRILDGKNIYYWISVFHGSRNEISSMLGLIFIGKRGCGSWSSSHLDTYCCISTAGTGFMVMGMGSGVLSQ